MVPGPHVSGVRDLLDGAAARRRQPAARDDQDAEGEQGVAIVMKMWGLADGSTHPADGQYLKGYDPEAEDGRGEATFTADIEDAAHFDNMVEAFRVYQAVPRCRPLRPDRRPNKPLTEFNWEFLPHTQSVTLN
jgi:hypothetical protein